jgi:hypothetical protein
MLLRDALCHASATHLYCFSRGAPLHIQLRGQTQPPGFCQTNSEQDTLRSDDQFGPLVVCPLVAHRGGDLPMATTARSRCKAFISACTRAACLTCGVVTPAAAATCMLNPIMQLLRPACALSEARQQTRYSSFQYTARAEGPDLQPVTVSSDAAV